MVLAKDKNEDEALRYLIKSVHLYAMNWSAWLEITALMNRIEDVSIPYALDRIATHSISASTNHAHAPTKYHYLSFPHPHFA